MPEEQLLVKLEDLYYVDHPTYRTKQQLVDLMQQLAEYEENARVMLRRARCGNDRARKETEISAGHNDPPRLVRTFVTRVEASDVHDLEAVERRLGLRRCIAAVPWNQRGTQLPAEPASVALSSAARVFAVARGAARDGRPRPVCLALYAASARYPAAHRMP
jgi:hypothetical protein